MFYFAATFLITDIVSEVYGKKDAKRAVHIGITTSIVFIILSQWWLLYTPDSTDFAMPAMQTIFFKYTKTYDCKYGCIRYSSGI